MLNCSLTIEISGKQCLAYSNFEETVGRRPESTLREFNVVSL